MTTFGSRIRALGKELGKDEQDIAKELGLTKSRLSHYINGRSKVPSELLQKIVDTYKVNPSYLFRDEAPLYVSESKVEYNTGQYNYLPTTISAGLPLTVEAITQADKIKIPDEIMGKYAGKNDLFVTRVSGDSMNKVMADKSLIVVQSIDNLNALKNGDIVVYSNDHEYSVKHYYKDGNKLIFKPNSTNPIHYDQIYNIDDNITIHGKVVVYIVNLD